MIETDTIECIIALGKNLFYNSAMESSLLIRRTDKDSFKKGKILFINAVDKVKNEKTMSFLLDGHIESIYNAYKRYEDIEGFSRVVSNEDVMGNDGTLLVSSYVTPEIEDSNVDKNLEFIVSNWKRSSVALKASMKTVFCVLEEGRNNEDR